MRFVGLRTAFGAIFALLSSGLLAGCGPAPQAGLPPAPRVKSAVTALGPGVRDVGLLVEPDDGTRAITRAIRQASTSIWLTMYLLSNRTIIHDLEYAHASGVNVRVILEPHPYGSSSNSNRRAYDDLMAADIPVHWSSPSFRLTHEKSMLVDGATAYIMTTNFTRSAFRSNREFDVIDRNSRDVAAVKALFNADWSARAYTPDDPNLPLSPIDARALLTALIRSARHTLDIYAEELQDTGMERAIAAAARRGVQVRLILPRASGTDRNAPGAAIVAAAGTRVHFLPQNYLYVHAKAIVADGARAFVGSENLSTASLDDNRELGVVVADRDAIATLEGTFNGDWRYQGGQ